MNEPYIIDGIETKAGTIPRISTELSGIDVWGAILVRIGNTRMNYTVAPGLYAVGNPNPDSVVLVSANYKLSFDVLRKNLPGRDAWILVLDTKGVNVWCSAGKGTFGTDEIVNRIERTRLKDIVNHRRLIVPQLGAPGIAAHTVKSLSGFSVIYGPVRASDIDAFLSAGMQATPRMRQVEFSLPDRLVLVPMEMNIGFKYLVFLSAVFFLLAGLDRTGYSVDLAASAGTRSTVILLLAYLAGTVAGPALLPWLAGRSFSVKGCIPGIVFFIILYFSGMTGNHVLEPVAWLLMVTAISSFATMNFTGASTYTSLSGVKKEMRIAVPLQIIAASSGMVLWIIDRFR